MLSNTSVWPLVWAILAWHAGHSESVTLSNWRTANCNSSNGGYVCYNIASLPGCCSTPGRYFTGGTATGVSSTDFHILFGPSGGQNCGISRVATNGGSCIASNNCRGHGWCRLCNTKKAKRALADSLGTPLEMRDEMDAPEFETEDDAQTGGNCTTATRMTPDGIHYFRVNEYDMTAEDNDVVNHIYDMEDQYSYETLTHRQLQYEVEPPEDLLEDVEANKVAKLHADRKKRTENREARSSQE